MLSAATARGLCPCGPRQLGRRGCAAPQQPHHQRLARHHAGRPTAETPKPRPSLLTSSEISFSGRAAVITDRGALRPLAPARPHGGTSRPSGVHLWRTSPVMDARGTTQTAASAAGQAASQQEVAASAGAAMALPDSDATDRTGGSGATRTPSSPAPASVPASAPNDSAAAAAQLLRGALEAALLPRLEAMEGRIVGAMEARIVESMEAMEGRMTQRMEKQVQQKEVGAGERRLTAAPEAVVAGMRAQGQREQRELAQEHGQEEAPVQEQEQAPTIALAAMEQRIREELKAEVAALRSELLLAVARVQQEREGQPAAAVTVAAAATAAKAAGAAQASNTPVRTTDRQLPTARVQREREGQVAAAAATAPKAAGATQPRSTQPGGQPTNRKPAWQGRLWYMCCMTVVTIVFTLYMSALFRVIAAFLSAAGSSWLHAVAWFFVMMLMLFFPVLCLDISI